MSDWIDEALRGPCQTCKKVMALSEMVVGWYGHWIADEDSLQDDPPEMLIGVTHPGLCAEAFGEGRGDDCAWHEYQPYEFVPIARKVL